MTTDIRQLKGNALLDALGINERLLFAEQIDFIDISEAKLRVYRGGHPDDPLSVPPDRVGEIKKVLERRGFFVRRPD